MKKLPFFVVITMCYATLIAQIPPPASADFDKLFKNVSLTDASTGIIYDRVVPFSNLPQFNSLNNRFPDTLNANTFFQCYSELYHSAVIHSARLSYSIEDLRVLLPKDTNLIYFGAILYKFNTIDNAVATRKLFLGEDSLLYENPEITESLFLEDTAFVAAPLTNYVYGNSVHFYFSENLLFSNIGNGIHSLLIDFDDGVGFRNVIPNSTITIDYIETGIHTIHTRMMMEDGQILDSYASINCIPRISISHPKTIFDIQAKIPFRVLEDSTTLYSGGKMCIYYANADKKLRKPILISDGFDPENERSFETGGEDNQSLWSMLTYNGRHLGDTLISKLGYDLVFIDYDDGGNYIERNAMVCIAAIDTLNKMLKQNESNEQIVVVGPSMGGVVTNYALSYIENNPNSLTNFGKHNCRLWIAFDSPQQGANISLGAQAFMYFYGNIANNQEAKDCWETYLNCTAAKQMLIHHLNAYPLNITLPKDTIFINQYTPESHFTQFYNSLNNLGYPQHLRKISVIDGSLNATTNEDGCAEAIDIRTIGNIRVSKIQLIPTSGNCESFYGMYSTKLEYLFGLKKRLWVSIKGFGNYSIDAAPGGTFNTFTKIEKAVADMSQSNNDFQLQPSVSIENHCFMPITSTLDISGNLNYRTNVSDRDLVEESITPFDSYKGVLDSNMYHATLNQDMADYILNEIETYILGDTSVQLCTTASYTLHLPEDTVADVIWYSSENIRIVATSDPYTISIVPLAAGSGWVSAEVSTLTFRKRLPNYAITIRVNEDNIFPVVSGTTVPQQTLNISGEMLLADTFCIESGKTMSVTGILHCTSAARLIVRPGGRLVVDGGTLTNACSGELWEGICIVGDRTKRQTPANQGVVELKNGAVIENARNAIRTGAPDEGWHTTGGIVYADSVTFRNNRRSAEFLSYADTTGSGAIRGNLSRFNRCSFTVDSSNLFAANGTAFAAHVTLWDVNAVKFSGCSFSSTMNGKAIYTIDGGFSVNAYCSMPSTGAVERSSCGCPAAYARRSTFSGFTTAIAAGTTGSQYAVTVDNADFAANGCGVSVSGNGHATVTRCDFDLQNSVRFALDATGIYLKNCSGYKVEENTFRRARFRPADLRYGIRVANSGDDDNTLYRNTFSNMTYATYITGDNGSASSGLQCSCNTFNGGQYDLYLASGSLVSPWQGSQSKGANNTFTSTSTSSIRQAGTQFLTYFHSPGTSFVPYSPTAGKVAVVATASANTCASTICGSLNASAQASLPTFVQMRNTYDSLYAVFESQGYESVLSGEDGTADASAVSSARAMQSQLVALSRTLSETSQSGVRENMGDTAVNLAAVEAWHSVNPHLYGRYAESETRFQQGLGNAQLLHGIGNMLTAQEEQDEHLNYMAFDDLKHALSNSSHAVNWPAASEVQVAELQQIAGNGNGRSAAMANNVLCFFFGICTEDDRDAETGGNIRGLLQGHSAENGSLTAYPNPTDGEVTVKSQNLDIIKVTVLDAYGRRITEQNASGHSCRIDVSSLAGGIYLLKSLFEDGTTETIKIAKQ